MTKREALCPHCRVNLLEYGIVEVLEGATTNTEITFSKGVATFGATLCDELTDQWIVCMNCNKDITNGVSAVDVVNFADGATDTINGLKTNIDPNYEVKPIINLKEINHMPLSPRKVGCFCTPFGRTLCKDCGGDHHGSVICKSILKYHSYVILFEDGSRSSVICQINQK